MKLAKQITWTPEMICKLKQLRSNGTPLFLCAEIIGVAYDTVVHQARNMGIAGRMNRGRWSGPFLKSRSPS